MESKLLSGQIVATTALILLALVYAGPTQAQGSTDYKTRCVTQTSRDGHQYVVCEPQPPVVLPHPPSASPLSNSVIGGPAPPSAQSGSAPSSHSGSPTVRSYSASPSVTVPSYAPSSNVGPAPRRLYAIRGIIEDSEPLPEDVAGYGVVAFTNKPLDAEMERARNICEAYKATLLTPEDLPPGTARTQQMITFWPVTQKSNGADCAELVSKYSLRRGLEAIADADKVHEGLASKRGPFLIAWAPSNSRSKPDSLALVMDMSAFQNESTFVQVLRDWRQKIVDNPQLWKHGFDVEAVRLIIRDTFDRYGDVFVRIIKG